MARRSPRKPLARLLVDTGGNTLAIMAAALFPLAGLVGGGVDMSRLYLTKSRLQQACDAGALAGRKVMGAATWDANAYAANTEAVRFFDSNFQNGAYGTGTRTRSFSEAAGRVSGAASVVVPMTIMRIFQSADTTVDVTCMAEMRLPNTDIMFVLDTTGSMAGKAAPTDPNDKIVTLRHAVKCFYESLARLDVSDANCGPTAPSGGTGGLIQLRFGFMPYSTNVNVGKLLPTSYIADSWQYQTRSNDGSNESNWSSWSGHRTWEVGASDTCNATKNSGNYEYRVFKFDRMDDGEKKYYCYQQRRWKNAPKWLYSRQHVNVSRLKSGTAWKSPIASFTLPIGHFRADKTITWDGCVEERETIKATSYDPLPIDPAKMANWQGKDLDIDSAPTTDAATKWGPALEGLIYGRRVLSDLDQLDREPHPSSEDYFDYAGQGLYSCPTQASKLVSWADAGGFRDYVNGLKIGGNTHHDIGMLWGARFMSPTGIFRTENATAGSKGGIERHMIFMTDGDTQTSVYNYAAYGVPWFDRRQTDDAVVPTDADTDAQVDARLVALCEAVKNKNITLHVISFGGGVNATTEARLKACSTGPASAKKFYDANDAAGLTKAFESIADDISELRLTK